MNALTRQVFDYLTETGDNQAAGFLAANCTLENQYFDTAFDIVGDGHNHIFDVKIYVPENVYHSIARHSALTDTIQNAVEETARADGVGIRHIQWLVDLRSDVYLSAKTISYLKDIITGDAKKTPYASGPQLVKFFNQFGLSDIGALFKAVADGLKLSFDENQKTDRALRKMISGLFSIVSGIAELGNDMGDRHGAGAKKVRTDRHHAVLVVNAAKTLSEFVLASFESQVKQ